MGAAGQGSVAGKRALVTGASSGLGRHFARTLAREGARVVLAARRTDRLAETCADIARAGGEARPVALDVTSAVSVRRAVEEACALWGGLDILVNNAGVTTSAAFLDLTEEGWDRVLDTDLKGCFLVAQAVAQRMVQEAAGGAIVNVASILGQRVSGHVSAYIAAKAGLIRLTQAMALELARHRIRVNALCPGYMETELNVDFFATPAGEALIRRIPARRLGRPEELEGPLLLLASDAGSYMTGAVLAVDGGHLVNPL